MMTENLDTSTYVKQLAEMMAGNFPATFDDGILKKNNHGLILMIEKNEKPIIHSAEDKVLKTGNL